MAVSERVIVELEARLDRYERDLAGAERNFDRRMRGIEGSANRTERLVSRAMGGISGALAGVSVLALAKQFLDIADASKSLDAQLRLATSGFGSFGKAQDDVRKIAADTRSGLEETASLYGNFSRAGKDLGATQADVARATETFSKALKISGADANSSASATLQFGQALASGALRGDELNSVLEAAPRLTTLLTDSMGKSKGEIKALGEAGELTSDKLLNALTNKKFTASIDAEFGELPVTFDQAMEQVSNAAIITFGAFDRGGQFSTALANFITDGTDGFKDLEQSALDMGVQVRASIEGLASAFAPVFAEAERFFAYMNNGSAKIDLGRDIQKSLDQIDMITSKVGGSNFGGRYRDARDKSERVSRGEIAERGLTDIANGLGLDRFGNSTRTAPVPRPAASGTKAKPKATSAASAAAKAEREREKAIRDEASSARESARLQDDITAAKAAMAVATRDILQFNLDQINSEEKQRTAEYETQAKLGKLSQQELADRTAAVAQIADLQRQRVFQIADENEKREELETKQAGLANEQDLLRAQSNLTASREERRDIELRLVDLAYQQERNELDAVIASTTATQAQKDIAEARLKILGQLKAADVESANRQAEGPLARYRRDLDNPDRRNDEVETAVVGELESVRDNISSAVQKTLGVKNPILAALINSFIEQQLIQPLLAGVSGATGGGGFFGGIISGIGGLFGGGRAIGGPVTAGRAYDVGESGREMFVPQQNGVIVPNHALKGGGGPTIINQTFTLDARGGITTPELLQYVNATASQAATQMGGVVAKGVLKAMPGRLSGYQRDGT